MNNDQLQQQSILFGLESNSLGTSDWRLEHMKIVDGYTKHDSFDEHHNEIVKLNKNGLDLFKHLDKKFINTVKKRKFSKCELNEIAFMGLDIMAVIFDKIKQEINEKENSILHRSRCK